MQQQPRTAVRRIVVCKGWRGEGGCTRNGSAFAVAGGLCAAMLGSGVGGAGAGEGTGTGTGGAGILLQGVAVARATSEAVAGAEAEGMAA